MRPTPPEHVAVKRSDPVYMAHSYLTKVPMAAIRPFIEAFTEPGDVVLDPFAGSGMTGVAAAASGRRAVLSDINVLGRHVGSNYVNLVEADVFRGSVSSVIERAIASVGDVYATRCTKCGDRADLSRTTWSVVCACQHCGGGVNYYRELERADWSKSRLACPQCDKPFSLRGSAQLNEVAVLDTIACSCEKTLKDQAPSEPLAVPTIAGLWWPDVRISPDRQMFQASALQKHNLTTTASFFSRRNIAVLAALRIAIDEEADAGIRAKLLFAFTAILARASKRYQWSRKRPLNAAHQHYYVAPVFYEWNVFDLFQRKSEAVIRSDNFLRAEMRASAFIQGSTDEPLMDVAYRLVSADELELDAESVNYVFTDPPFGSNIFYSDMSLFQEAWLDHMTEYEREAVVDRSRTGAVHRTAERYERLIAGALCECHRVLKPEGWLSVVFSNSSGAMWALLQRAVATAGFVIDADHIAVLDKGQRSVKGLASGFENVVTADLVLSMQKTDVAIIPKIKQAPSGFLDRVIGEATAGRESDTPSHVYLGVIREYLRADYDLREIDMRKVAGRLADLGFEVDRVSGAFVRNALHEVA